MEQVILDEIVISVVMPNYNTTIENLNEAVKSILAQTYTNFEFIILDDCSTNGSYEWLAGIEDSRVRLFKNEKNMGITKTLNKGFRYARGKYIARMDSDDIALPTRFEKQIQYMEKNPSVIVCGTSVEYFGDESRIEVREMPSPEVHRCSFLFGNQYGLYHPTAFFRRDMIEKYHIKYDEDLPTAQDYGMWTECSRYGIISWLEEVLLKYRIHAGQVSVAKCELQEACTLLVQRKQLAQLLQREPTEREIETHKKACSLKGITKDDLEWFSVLKEENKKSGYLPTEELSEYIDEFVEQKVHNVTKVGKKLGKMVEMMTFLPMRSKIVMVSTLYQRIIRRGRLILLHK